MWSKTFGGAASDTGMMERAMSVQASDGGYAILGVTSSFGAGGSDFWLIKIDADGNMEWNMTYGGTGNEISGYMCLTSDDKYVMSGYTASFGAGGEDFWLVKVDSSGNMQWNQTYGGTGNEYPYHVIQTVDEGYALLGRTNSFGAGGNDFWLLKVAENSNPQWNQTYGGTGNDLGIHVTQTGDGGYALLGTTTSFGAGGTDIWLIKTDANGNMQWNQTYGGTGTDYGYPCLIQAIDGGFTISCITNSFGAGNFDSWLIRTDSSGNMLWNKTYGGTAAEGALHMIQTADGGFALAGFVSDNANDFSLVKLDEAFNVEWNMSYGGAGFEWADNVIQTADGGYLLTGNTNSFGAGSYDIWLVKVDEAGVVPEGLTLAVMLLLSTVAVIVSMRYYSKRPKWSHW